MKVRADGKSARGPNLPTHITLNDTEELMSHSQNYATNLEEQLSIHRRYSPYKFIKIDPKLVSKIGIEAAAVYSALQYKFEGLVTDTESSQYTFLEENDGWFYMSQAQLVEKTGMTKKVVRNALDKLIGTLIEEKKLVIKNCTRSVFCFRHTGGDARGGIGGMPEGASGDARGGIHTRVTIYKRNNNKNIYTRTRVEKNQQEDVSKTNNSSNCSKTNNSKDIDPKFIELASEWEPKLSRSPVTEKQILRASNVLQKLVEEFGFSFQELKLGIEWAYNDNVPQRGGFCWRKYFKTLTGLDKRNTGSATNTEDIKFQKIHDARLRSIEQDPETIYNERIEAIVRKFWDEPEDEDSVQRCIDDVDWFQNKLERINNQRMSKYKFTWHEGEPFIKVVEFLIDIEANSRKTFKYVMTAYLEFLQYKLQDGTIQTLYPGNFSKTSEIFRQYLAEDYHVTGRKLLDWQKGDFDE